MKKLLFVSAFIMMAAFDSFSQCIPDTSVTHNVSGIYPDSATGLPHAVASLPYSTVIQLKVVQDTTYMGIPATVDSVIITNVTGMPAGFSYLCTPGNCHFPGGSDACILLQNSLVDPSYAGQTYPLTVNVTAYGHAGIIPATLPANINRYSIVVDFNTGIASIVSNRFDVGQNIPNPFSRTSEISFSSPASESVTLKISNLLGKVVYTKSILAQRGLNKITLMSRDFYSGIYIYTLSNSKNSITKRMIVSNE